MTTTFENQPRWAKEQCTPTKSIVVNADGRIRVAWKLEQGWDGDIYIAENGKAIIQETVYSKDSMFDPKKHFENEGIFDVNDVFFNLLSVERKETYKLFLDRNPTDRRGRSNTSGSIIFRDEIFKLPFSIRNKFQDRNGSPEQSILIDSVRQIGDWAVGYVQRESPDDDVISTTRIRRRRGATDGGSSISTGTRTREEGFVGGHGKNPRTAATGRGSQRIRVNETDADGDATFADAQQSPRTGGGQSADPRSVSIPVDDDI